VARVAHLGSAGKFGKNVSRQSFKLSLGDLFKTEIEIEVIKRRLHDPYMGLGNMNHFVPHWLYFCASRKRVCSGVRYSEMKSAKSSPTSKSTR